MPLSRAFSNTGALSFAAQTQDSDVAEVRVFRSRLTIAVADGPVDIADGNQVRDEFELTASPDPAAAEAPAQISIVMVDTKGKWQRGASPDGAQEYVSMTGRACPTPHPRERGRALVAGLLLVVSALLAACGDGDRNPLASTEWRLVALGDADAPAEVLGGDPTTRFTTATDMTGWTGCNAYGASYRVRDSELRLDELTWTEAGCPSQALFRQEQRMQDLLATVERFEVSGDRLTLYSEGGQALIFERVGE